MLGLFATQTAIAIRNAQLYDAQRERLPQRSALSETALDISSQLDMPLLLQSINEWAATMRMVAMANAWIDRAAPSQQDRSRQLLTAIQREMVKRYARRARSALQRPRADRAD